MLVEQEEKMRGDGDACRPSNLLRPNPRGTNGKPNFPQTPPRTRESWAEAGGPAGPALHVCAGCLAEASFHILSCPRQRGCVALQVMTARERARVTK